MHSNSPSMPNSNGPTPPRGYGASSFALRSTYSSRAQINSPTSSRSKWVSRCRESAAEVSYGAEFLRWFSEEAVRINGRNQLAPNGNGYLVTTGCQ